MKSLLMEYTAASMPASAIRAFHQRNLPLGIRPENIKQFHAGDTLSRRVVDETHQIHPLGVDRRHQAVHTQTQLHFTSPAD